MDQGTFWEGVVRKGLGAKENVLLGRAGSGQQVGNRTGRLGHFTWRFRDPLLISHFCPQSWDKAEKMPWVCGTSVVCHPFKCSHFK